MLKPTQEQIANNKLIQQGNNVCVIAGAGTGKSSSLRFIASQNPDKNFLVLCFNTANVVESNAHTDKPDNIYYSTFHAIAYRELVDQDMRKKLHGYLNYRDVNQRKLLDARLLPNGLSKKEEKERLFLLVRGMLDAITLYCRSDSSNLQLFAEGLFAKWFYDKVRRVITPDGFEVEVKSVELSPAQQKKLAELTRAHWLMLIDTGSDYYISHDVYLKLYHLRAYTLNYFWDKLNKEIVPIDVLVIDEGQDSNPVQLAIFNATTGIQKAIIGDSMQQIYAWRCAVDAMDMFPDYKEGKLTNSFRFNQGIADMANKILAYAGSNLRLTGSYTGTSIKTKAILCRSNVRLIANIVAACNANLKVYTTTDLKDTFSKMYHLQAVRFGNVPKFPDRTLKDIVTKEALDDALRISDDLQLLVKLIIFLSKAEGGLHASIKRVKSSLVDTAQEANVIVSTIHKSKGLEYDEVTIDDKLITFKEEENGDCDVQGVVEKWLSDKENLNLLYVAITRAKVRVNVPEYLDSLFN